MSESESDSNSQSVSVDGAVYDQLVDEHIEQLLRARAGIVNSPTQPAQQSESDPFTTFEQSGRWLELGSFCEHRLATQAEDWEAKLWWLKSQLESAAVPLSILSAPLESTTRLFLEDTQSAESSLGAERFQRLKAFAVRLLGQMGELLLARGDSLLAASFLEKAWKTDGSHSQPLLKAVEKALHEFESLPQYKRESSAGHHIEKLRHLRDSLQGPNQTRNGAKPAPLLKQSSSEASEQIFPLPPVRSQPRRRSFAPMLAVLVTVIGGAALYWYLWMNPNFASRSNAEIALARSALPDFALSPAAPKLSRISDVRGFDALLYDIENGARAMADTPSITPAPQVDMSAAPARQRSGFDRAPTGKEQINTSTPREPQQIARIMEEGAGPDDPESRVIDRDFVNEFPGRSKPVAREAGSPVFRFSPPRMYRLISDSEVMSRPSYQAASVSTLYEGERIRVVEAFGPWLKFLFRRGEYGYLFAQDAEPDDS